MQNTAVKCSRYYNKSLHTRCQYSFWTFTVKTYNSAFSIIWFCHLLEAHNRTKSIDKYCTKHMAITQQSDHIHKHN